MSRTNRPRPIPQLVNPDTARRVLETFERTAQAVAALAEGAQAIAQELNVAGTTIAAAIRSTNELSAAFEARERLVARDLGPEHLGRWVSLEANNTGPDGLSLRPAGDSGRLVGIRPGPTGGVRAGGGHPTLVLVLQQGQEQLKAAVKLTDVIRIGSSS